MTDLSIDMMRRRWPRADQYVSGLNEGIVAAAPTVFPKYGLTTSLTIAHAMAQFSHECGAGTEMVENINYTAARACQVWPSRFHSVDDVYAKVGSSPGDPSFHIKLMDNVYGNRMGNRPGTHDGSAFIGRGLSQCTGREGYAKLAAKTGLDVLNHPELLSDPAHALELGVADFIICGCLQPALDDDVVRVTRALNGGLIGLAEREQWLAVWKRELLSGDPTGHDAAWVQAALNKIMNAGLVVDGNAGPRTRAAVGAFQTSRGLTADGIVGPLTLAVLEKALAPAQTETREHT